LYRYWQENLVIFCFLFDLSLEKDAYQIPTLRQEHRYERLWPYLLRLASTCGPITLFHIQSISNEFAEVQNKKKGKICLHFGGSFYKLGA